MRQSRLFTKTRKEAPSDEVSKNAKLLIRGGFIHKEMAGVYAYLPLGLRVLKKIETIIREEMNAIGGQEILLTALQSEEIWESTDRWLVDDDELWFKTKLVSGSKLGLGWSHEEPLTNLLTQHVSSYKDLPIYPYQFQTKFRNELRAKSGILRGREFLMKDLYSFSRSKEEHNAFYEKAKVAYHKIFERTGVGTQTYLTFASGGVFSEYSHEFQTLTSAGEDLIYICDDCRMAVNKEIIDKQSSCPECSNEELREEKAVEGGNIFSLGTRFSEAMDLTYQDENGEGQYPIMGCYGIGLGRVMGIVVEVLSDDDGIVWPESIAPFQVHMVSLGDDEEVEQRAENLYSDLQDKGVEVLWDDRNASAGEKFSDSDLLGIPHRVVVSSKTLDDKSVGHKPRISDEEKRISTDELLSLLEE